MKLASIFFTASVSILEIYLKDSQKRAKSKVYFGISPPHTNFNLLCSLNLGGTSENCK